MPMTRISLLKGKSREYLQAISDSLHQALVDAFEIPADDRFQVFHQHEPEELVFDRHYIWKCTIIASDGIPALVIKHRLNLKSRSKKSHKPVSEKTG